MQAHPGGSEVQLHPWEFNSPGSGGCLAITARTQDDDLQTGGQELWA